MKNQFIIIIRTIALIFACTVFWNIFCIIKIAYAVDQSLSRSNQLASLPIGFLGGTRTDSQGRYALIEYFNQIARDDDMIYFTEASLLQDKQKHLEAIAQVKKGKIIQAFSSLQTAKREIDSVKGAIDGISYDLELWQKSNAEWQDIEGASRKMSEIARSNNLLYLGHLGIKLSLGKKKDPLGIEHMAKYTDYYSAAIYPCLEKYCMDECVELMRSMVERAKKANPKIKVLVAVSLEKNIPLEQQYEFLRECSGFIDGIGIFLYPGRSDSEEKLKRLIKLIRGYEQSASEL